MGSSTHPNGSSWATIREDLRARRNARAARKALEHDIASYTTPAELNELNSILQRHEDTEVADIRRIVDRRRAA
jgi:hypothetical protein